MPSREVILDPAEVNFENVVADQEAIRQIIPQRGAMEQLTAIVYDDLERHIVAGYRDVSEQEFWVEGHMPGLPLMPGVVMCEAAAQVFSYHSQRHDLLGAQVLGFGGLDNVRFRGVVRPGDRLLMVCQMTRLRRGRIITCDFQGFVGANIVCEGEVRGIPLPIDELRRGGATSQ